ncbi:MAG: Organic solvent tolerance protein [Pedosphaera sp.]|nr:Organic solvent tolerance protein [Pedosphaera sp.]
MKKLCASILFLFLWVSLAGAQLMPEEAWEIEALNENSGLEHDLATGRSVATNGVVVKYGSAILTATKATIDERAGDVFAEGSVRIQKDDQTWIGERVRYNFKTSQMESGPFKTGKFPAFAAGTGLKSQTANKAFPISNTNSTYYIATNTFVTTDDFQRPFEKIRAKRLKIVPGKYFEAYQAVLYAGELPIFYFPYYRRNLSEHGNNFVFVPGYRSAFGPYLLTTYNWFINPNVDGSVHADLRQKRGIGGGPDLNLHLGRWGEGAFKYYYTYDEDPGINGPTPVIPASRQRFYFSYDGEVRTNLDIKSQVAYQSDVFVIHDFFEGEFRKNIQPNTFFEVNQGWQNWSLDALAQPRVNGFFETVERLPDVRLNGFRQQIADTPLYYESESTIGYYRRLFSDTNIFSANFSAARADTFHQITLPETLFGWLNFTPRVGGRFTYYSEATGPGATTTEHYRKVFNTGAELTTKASQVWPGYQNHFFEMDGLRHIIEPSLNYVYVPSPSTPPSQLPQFDYELTNSFALLPIDFPDFNSIDSIDSQNVIRYGLRNRLQTKRNGHVEDMANWGVYLDWNLTPRSGQSTFSDIYSDLSLKPKSWLTLRSTTRYSIGQGVFELAQHNITLQPNDRWSWGVGHFYLRTSPQFGIGHNLFSSMFYYRFNENWGARLSHYFEARTGTMQEQYYTLYRDLRSWTAALTFRVRDNGLGRDDYTFAVSFSLKAAPRFRLNQDTVNASSLVGY